MRHGFTFKGLLLSTLLLSTAQISFADFDDLAIFEMTKAAQAGLIRKGYAIGKPDGSCGPSTAAAVRTYLAPILAEQQLEPISSEEDACQLISKAYGELEEEYDGDLAKQLGFRTVTVSEIEAANKICISTSNFLERLKGELRSRAGEFISYNMDLWLIYADDGGFDKVKFEKELRCFVEYFRN